MSLGQVADRQFPIGVVTRYAGVSACQNGWRSSQIRSCLPDRHEADRPPHKVVSRSLEGMAQGRSIWRVPTAWDRAPLSTRRGDHP